MVKNGELELNVVELKQNEWGWNFQNIEIAGARKKCSFQLWRGRHMSPGLDFSIKDMYLPPTISKCISDHLITRTANEKPR
jgi:hypothetical protein